MHGYIFNYRTAQESFKNAMFKRNEMVMLFLQFIGHLNANISEVTILRLDRNVYIIMYRPPDIGISEGTK